MSGQAEVWSSSPTKRKNKQRVDLEPRPPTVAWLKKNKPHVELEPRSAVNNQDTEHESVRTVESPVVMSRMQRIQAHVVISGGYATVFWRYHFQYAFILVIKKGPQCVHVSCAR